MGLAINVKLFFQYGVFAKVRNIVIEKQGKSWLKNYQDWSNLFSEDKVCIDGLNFFNFDLSCISLNEVCGKDFMLHLESQRYIFAILQSWIKTDLKTIFR